MLRHGCGVIVGPQLSQIYAMGFESPVGLHYYTYLILRNNLEILKTLMVSPKFCELGGKLKQELSCPGIFHCIRALCPVSLASVRVHPKASIKMHPQSHNIAKNFSCTLLYKAKRVIEVTSYFYIRAAISRTSPFHKGSSRRLKFYTKLYQGILSTPTIGAASCFPVSENSLSSIHLSQ